MTISGYVGTTIPVTVNFLPSRAGLTTVGYTLLDQELNVIQGRTTQGVSEMSVAGAPSGVYKVELRFTVPVTGYIIWDTGQPVAGTEPNKLRAVQSSVVVSYAQTYGDIMLALDELGLNVAALFEENTMKIPDGTAPSSLRIVRKRFTDPDWSNPIYDSSIPIDQRPGRQRFGGPPIV